MSNPSKIVTFRLPGCGFVVYLLAVYAVLHLIGFAR